MVLLLAFVIAYGVIGVVDELGRGSWRATTSGTRRAASGVRTRVGKRHGRWVKRVRKAGPRNPGWWAWLAGTAAWRTSRFGFHAATGIYDAVERGAVKGAAHGREKHTEYVARRDERKARKAAARTVVDEAPTDVVDGEPGPDAMDWSAEPPVHDPQRHEDEPGDLRFGDDPHDPNDTHQCPYCKGTAILDGQPCPHCHSRQQQRNEAWEAEHGARVYVLGTTTQPTRNESETPMSTMTGETTDIQATRDLFAAAETEANKLVGILDQASSNLQQYHLDPQTLADVTDLMEAANTVKAAATKARAGIDQRHSAMEEAVNSTPHPADTDWYKHA